MTVSMLYNGIHLLTDEKTRTHLPLCPTRYQNILGTDSFFTERKTKKNGEQRECYQKREGVGNKMKINCVLGRPLAW